MTTGPSVSWVSYDTKCPWFLNSWSWLEAGEVANLGCSKIFGMLYVDKSCDYELFLTI